MWTEEQKQKLEVERRENIERFWSRVDIKENNECWNWKAGRCSKGYGTFKINRKVLGTHRVAFALANNMFSLLCRVSIPDGLHVLHSCDNPPCCNPMHLRLGTNKENQEEKDAKGRGNNGYSKTFKTPDINVIIRMREEGFKRDAIAKHLGVSDKTVSNYYRRYMKQRTNLEGK